MKIKVSVLNIATYHIYHDGRIEKHIPKNIQQNNQYKYVYHDEKGGVHEVCIVEWHTIKEKQNGVFHSTKPTHSKIIYDESVSEGNTSRRIKYENGDIAEFGLHPTKGKIWILYKAKSNTVELLKMPDYLNYIKNDVIINYTFSGSQRRYTNPNNFAGFIGALAKTKLSIISTGSCFSGGSSFPSQLHINGESIDTNYFWDKIKDQLFIDAMKFFHFRDRKAGNNAYFKNLKNVSDGGNLHDTHLHCGSFDTSKVKIINF